MDMMSSRNPTPRIDQSMPNGSSERLSGPLPTHATYSQSTNPPQLAQSPFTSAPTISRTASPTSPKHGRSLSHPFPSLFGIGKKTAKVHPPECERHASEMERPRSTVQRVSKDTSSSTPRRNRDMITGKCLTCDSNVRWPKDLDVFRCTICLTINDLSETTPLRRLQESGRNIDSAEESPGAEQVPKLSIETVKSLVDFCVRKHLENRLKIRGNSTIPVRILKPASRRAGSNSLGQESGDDTLQGPVIYLSKPADEEGCYDQLRTSSAKISEVDESRYSKSSPSGVCSPLESMRQGIWQHELCSAPTRAPPEPPKDLRDVQAGSIVAGDFRKTMIVPKSTENIAQHDEDPDRAKPRSKLDVKLIFKPLEEYVVKCFTTFECLNDSFTVKAVGPERIKSDAAKTNMRTEASSSETSMPLSGIDAKTLLLGDFAENGAWWAGNRDPLQSPGLADGENHYDTDSKSDLVSVKTPRINWIEVAKFYRLLAQAGEDWRRVWHRLKRTLDEISDISDDDICDMAKIEAEMKAAASHVQRVLLKASEAILKRPGRPIKAAADVRFVFIILANPQLYQKRGFDSENTSLDSNQPKGLGLPLQNIRSEDKAPERPPDTVIINGYHSGIIKRILGILSNLPNDCHHFLVSWFSRFSERHFRRMVELVGSFVNYRLTRQHSSNAKGEIDPTLGLVPSFAERNAVSSAQLYATLRLSAKSMKKKASTEPMLYAEDWQIKAAARVMALLFAANSNSVAARAADAQRIPHNQELSTRSKVGSQQRVHNRGQILRSSEFYNSLLDYTDLFADFEAWESRKGKFAFCQYPFFLSIWSKIRILEYDARRQMEVKAREAFFDSIMTKKTVSQYLILRVRRECLVEDSLRSVSEVVGTGQEDIKKGLRIEFVGEEGIDGGGLKKEWFLTLTRDIFDPHHGLFIYDEDSKYCYFNPYCFETSDQFFLVGVLLGLAIYNSTILDVSLPPFAFKKLLASAPGTHTAVSIARQPNNLTLDDLAEFRPVLAAGLRKLLEFEGDVEEVFCQDFVIDMDRYGTTVRVPLCPNGESKRVTNGNRKEFVELYVRYVIDTSVARQFEPFKRGFFSVCGGNALSLFRPEEIELLVCGSEEPLEVSSLRAVAQYDHWGPGRTPEQEPSVRWFWEFFGEAEASNQRKILSFITGSDRIPAMGATNLVIKVLCLGDDCERFPVARTCFNSIYLYRYCSKEKFEEKLWRAVLESEGFGLK